MNKHNLKKSRKGCCFRFCSIHRAIKAFTLIIILVVLVLALLLLSKTFRLSSNKNDGTLSNKYYLLLQIDPSETDNEYILEAYRLEKKDNTFKKENQQSSTVRPEDTPTTQRKTTTSTTTPSPRICRNEQCSLSGTGI